MSKMLEIGILELGLN